MTAVTPLPDAFERQLRARLSAGESWFAPDWEARLPRSFDPERFYL